MRQCNKNVRRTRSFYFLVDLVAGCLRVLCNLLRNKEKTTISKQATTPSNNRHINCEMLAFGVGQNIFRPRSNRFEIKNPSPAAKTDPPPPKKKQSTAKNCFACGEKRCGTDTTRAKPHRTTPATRGITKMEFTTKRVHHRNISCLFYALIDTPYCSMQNRVLSLEVQAYLFTSAPIMMFSDFAILGDRPVPKLRYCGHHVRRSPRPRLVGGADDLVVNCHVDILQIVRIVGRRLSWSLPSMPCTRGAAQPAKTTGTRGAGGEPGEHAGHNPRRHTREKS